MDVLRVFCVCRPEATKSRVLGGEQKADPFQCRNYFEPRRRLLQSDALIVAAMNTKEAGQILM